MVARGILIAAPLRCQSWSRPKLRRGIFSGNFCRRRRSREISNNEILKSSISIDEMGSRVPCVLFCFCFVYVFMCVCMCLFICMYGWVCVPRSWAWTLRQSLSIQSEFSVQTIFELQNGLSRQISNVWYRRQRITINARKRISRDVTKWIDADSWPKWDSWQHWANIETIRAGITLFHAGNSTVCGVWKERCLLSTQFVGKQRNQLRRKLAQFLELHKPQGHLLLLLFLVLYCCCCYSRCGWNKKLGHRYSTLFSNEFSSCIFLREQSIEVPAIDFLVVWEPSVECITFVCTHRSH